MSEKKLAKAQGTPRRKRYKKHIRLVHAAKWLEENSIMKNVIKGYTKWFGVSRICAAQELMLLGVTFDTDVVGKEKQLEIEKANQRKRAKEKRLQAHAQTYLYHWDAVDGVDSADYEDMPF